jgi:hypothetical protein
MYSEWLSLGFVALLWGVTNPLMKKSSRGVIRTKSDPLSQPPQRGFQQKCILWKTISQMLQDFIFWFRRPLYCAAFALNILGSIIFYLSLAHLGKEHMILLFYTHTHTNTNIIYTHDIEWILFSLSYLSSKSYLL